MTALPVDINDLEARIRAQSAAFDKSTERKAQKADLVKITNPGRYVMRIMPSRGYPNDVQFFRKLGRHFIKPEGTKGFLFNCDYHSHDTPCAICKAVRDAQEGKLGPAEKDVADGKFGKGSAKSSGKYLINVVMADKPDVVQTAEVPLAFIKFLRTFQDMVNLRFFDPQVGNLIAFDAVPAANGFGNDYKIVKQQVMPVPFTGDQIPDLDEVLKIELGDIKPTSAFTGSLVSPVGQSLPAGIAPAAGGFSTPAAAPAPAINAADPFGAFTVQAPAAPAPVAPAANSVPFDGPFVQAPLTPAADPFAAFTGGQATATAAAAQASAAAPAADPFAAFATSTPATPAAPVAPAPAAPAAPAASAPAASSAGGISQAEADDLQAKLLAMVGG